MIAVIPSRIAFGCALLGLALGCGESSDVPEASCTACGGASYSSAQCEVWGEAAGCKSTSFVPSASGSCNNGCSFKDCDEPPECGGSTGRPDPQLDAAVDPRCAASDDGLFTVDPPCDDADEFTLNGVRYYYCPCSGGCPCNYECSGIPLSVGGTIGSACAPR